MASHSNSSDPLPELKHDAVPGYLKAFTIAFAIMGIYLAGMLISSPGHAKKHGYGDKDHGRETNH